MKQAALLANASASLVYRWVAERRFPVYRLGAKGKRGKIVIDEPTFARFLETLKVGAAPEAPPETLKHITLR